MAAKARALVIYTGGTIGMLPEERGNPLSPLKAANWDALQAYVPSLAELPLAATIHQMEPIDSSNMHPGYWIDIARVIRDNYANYDGFVILHGTDTLTYTATALSFLLENLDKPVVLTGSQLPIGRPRTDALQNFVNSLTIAASRVEVPLVPEVCIFFDKVLLRGNRTRKVSSSGYAGFASPNYATLGEVGEHIVIKKEFVRGRSEEGFFINENLEKNVIMFDIFPGLDAKILKSLFDIDGLRGVVLRTYGAGNAPTDEDFIRQLAYGINKRDLTIVNVTQCNQGMVEMGLYDASAEMQRLGVISGVDMTPEAALVKLQFLLGLGYDSDTVRDQMQKDLRGEQSVNVFNFLFELGKAEPVHTPAAQQLPAGFNRERIVRANLRVDRASLPEVEPAGDIELAVFANYPSAANMVGKSDEECLLVPQCLGVMKKTSTGKAVNMVLDCTERFGRVVTPGRPIQFSITSRSGKAVRWDGIAVSVFTGSG